MKLIIDIPEDVYTRLFDNGIQDNEIAVDDVCEMAMAIRNGTPLPENHGRLIDGDALENRLNASAEYWLDTDSRLEAKFGKGIAEAADTIGDMETIVEAQNIGRPVERKYKLIEYKA